MDDLRDILKRVRLHLRLRDGWKAAQESLWVALSAGLLIQLVGRFFPLERLFLWTLISLLFWFLIQIGYTLLHPISLLRAARIVDHELGLRQRLSTALALDDIEPRFPASLITAQFHDALQHARAIHPSEDLPFAWRSNHLLIAGILSLLLLTSIFLPNPMDIVLAERAAVTAAIEEQAEEITKLHQKIDENQTLSEQDQDKLLSQLEELEVTLRSNPGDLESALAALSQLEADLQQELDPNTSARAANLESLAAQVEQLAGMDNSHSEADSLAATRAALQALAENAAQMSAPERRELANQLARLSAQALATSETQLAQSISNLSQAVAQGETSAASQAAKQAGEAITQIQTELAAQNAANQAIQAMQSSRTTLAQATSTSGNVSQVSNSNDPTNANTDNGSTSSSGMGASNASGSNAGAGGGNSANRLPPADRSGQAERPKGVSPDAPETHLESQVYAPWARSTTPRDQLFITGQEGITGETSIIEGKAPLPGKANPSLVPYNQVYYSYLNAANQAMKSNYIPSALADYVHAYFTELEP